MNAKTAGTVLKVTGIINIVFGCIGAIAGLLMVGGGNALTSALLAHGTGAEDAGLLSAGFAVIGVAAVIASAVDITLGILSIRASKNPSKATPALVLAVINLALTLAGFAFNVATWVDPQTIIAGAIGVGVTVLVTYAAAVVRSSARQG